MGVKAAFASGVVSAAIDDEGSLWVWGRSKRGQLGLGNGVIEATKPSKVEALTGHQIVKVQTYYKPFCSFDINFHKCCKTQLSHGFFFRFCRHQRI